MKRCGTKMSGKGMKMGGKAYGKPAAAKVKSGMKKTTARRK
jgi:hypothetical protein